MAIQHRSYLLADEVGLGKTIEAGLVMRELKLRGLVRRTLVVSPKGIATQWVSEMRTHFNEEFQLVLGQDMETLRRISSVKFGVRSADGKSFHARRNGSFKGWRKRPESKRFQAPKRQMGFKGRQIIVHRCHWSFIENRKIQKRVWNPLQEAEPYGNINAGFE